MKYIVNLLTLGWLNRKLNEVYVRGMRKGWHDCEVKHRLPHQ